MSGLRLDGRVAAVTGGAGRGISRAYARLLGQLGAKVVVNDLAGSTLSTGQDAAPADEVVKQIEASGGAAAANYADVSAVEGGKSVIDTAVQPFGGIDIVVNNAGTFGLMDNINCNAPNAMTRLAARTEEEQAQLAPPPAETDPGNAAPMVAYLAHESCQAHYLSHLYR